MSNKGLGVDTARSQTKLSYIYTIGCGSCQDVFYGRLWIVAKLLEQPQSSKMLTLIQAELLNRVRLRLATTVNSRCNP